MNPNPKILSLNLFLLNKMDNDEIITVHICDRKSFWDKTEMDSPNDIPLFFRSRTCDACAPDENGVIDP